MITFDEFINNLSKEDKQNFSDYSKMRGVQQYRIIFETLKKTDPNVEYKDVNAFIKYDKSIKDVLFTFLGALEEYIRNDIVLRFDFKNKSKNLKEYHDIKELPKCIEKVQKKDEITAFYKYFSLNFGDLISFIEKYSKDKYDTKSLKKIVKLRNKVMHHKLLLFDCNFSSTKTNTENWIFELIKQLPNDYPQYLADELNKKTEKTKSNIKKSYLNFVLSTFELEN